MVSQQSTCCICLPKDQSVKKLSTKARAPTEGPECQEVINKGQSADRRTRTSRSYHQRPERRPKEQSVKKLSTKARAPTEGPECQEVINKGQSADRRTRTSRSYQQRPECLPKDQSVKKISAKARKQKDNGNHTRIGRPYTMVVPINISSHREAGDLIVEINKQQEEGRTRPLIRTTRRCKKQTTRRHATKRLRHLMHDRH